jgi:fructuronate reductase/mannitol 2-dehydrogenase
VHVVASIAEARAAGRPHPLLTLAVAGWLRYLRGTDDDGRPIALDDPAADRLRSLAQAGGPDPRPLLAERSLFGGLAEDPAFAAEVTDALAAIDAEGARAAVQAWLAADERLAA